MRDEAPYFSVEARAVYAIWPGSEAICARVSCPKYVEDHWYLASVTTGEIGVLARYRLGMFGRRR
jgi:hypothetical protein